MSTPCFALALTHRHRLRTIVALLLMLAVSSVRAQLPTATGQQYTLSQSAWRIFIPTDYAPQAGGKYNLLVHFHGEPQTVWNNAKYADLDAVIVTVNYSGLSSAYSTPFATTSLFQQILDETNTRLARLPAFGAAASLDHLSVSSFSAGYGAVRQILGVPSYRNAIDSLLAADSLYATTASDGTALDSQMAGYKAFATAAAAGEKRFIFTHSQVPTYTYESTAETGDELMAHLGITATPTNATGLGDLRFYRTAELGGFSLWGALGSSADAHLSHLRYMGEWLDDLLPSAPTLPGDYNQDGVVNAADYTVWRDNLNGSNANLSADGNGNGMIEAGDYSLWAAAYGATATGGAIPEPVAVTLAAIGLVCCGGRRAGRRI